jgi:hypothetical protein
MGEIPSHYPICRPYAGAAMKRNQTDFRERFMIMKRCSLNMSLECIASRCPFKDTYFLEQLEAFLKDFPLRVNEIRMMHRCDIALSLVGYEDLAASYVYTGRLTGRRCNAMQVVYERWDRRKRANAAEIAAIMGFVPEKSSGTWADPSSVQ